jgi:hypothetical protein
MGDWQKTIDALVEAWEKFTTSIKEMVDARRLEFRHLRKRRKRVSALRLDMGCLCGNLEENPSLSSIPTGQLFRSTYLIREGTIENRPYKA